MILSLCVSVCVVVVLDFANSYFSSVRGWGSVLGSFYVCMCGRVDWNVLVTFFLMFFVGESLSLSLSIYIYIYILKKEGTRRDLYFFNLFILLLHTSYIYVWRCPWCNCYRRRKWTRPHEFKSWTRLIAFHIALIPLGKVWIQLFSLQLWVNSRTD